MRERALTTKNQRIDAETETFVVTHSLRGEGFDASEDGTGRGTPIIAFPANLSGTQCASSEDVSPSLCAINPTAVAGAMCRDVYSGGMGGRVDMAVQGYVQAIAFDGRMRGAEPAVGREERPPQTMVERTGALDATKPWNVATAMQVRRLTPLETERLMGFPDGYTAITVKGKPAADGPRYKSHGNSWAVNCASWIGTRIQQVDAIFTQNRPLARVE